MYQGFVQAENIPFLGQQAVLIAQPAIIKAVLPKEGVLVVLPEHISLPLGLNHRCLARHVPREISNLDPVHKAAPHVHKGLTPQSR